MEWIVEAETLSDFIDHGRYTITSKPLIRCKDCKWFSKAGCAVLIVDDSDKPSADDYCSFAERRTDG